MMVDKTWYPPINVAAHFETDIANVRPPKKAQEMMAVAIAMAGMQELHQRQYWIQGVLDSEQSPDVRTMYCDPPEGDNAPQCYQQDVEVVTYTSHSSGTPLDLFVADTKLSKESAYDELTTILVNIETGVHIPSPAEWSSLLTSTGKRNPVLVLGRISKNNIHRLAFVHPVFEGGIDYHAPTLLKKHGSPKVVTWSFGTKAKEVVGNDEKHCPFENFGVECKLL
jgi:hypothetical protein